MILKYRKISIANRLMAINFYTRKLTESDEDSIPSVSANVVNLLEKGGFDNFTESFPENDEIATEMEDIIYRHIISKYKRNGGSSLPFLREIWKNTTDFFGDCFLDGNTLFNYNAKEIHSKLKEKVQLYWEPFLRDRSYIVENYFVENVFSVFLSLKQERDGLDLFKVSFTYAEQFAKMKILMSVNAELYGGVTDELITDVIVLMSRSYSHGAEKRFVVDEYTARGMISPAHCSFLLK